MNSLPPRLPLRRAATTTEGHTVTHGKQGVVRLAAGMSELTQHGGSEAAATHVSGCISRTRKTLQLTELLGDDQGIDIDHNGHVYRLQITKAGKLILTK